MEVINDDRPLRSLTGVRVGRGGRMVAGVDADRGATGDSVRTRS